MLSIVLGCFFEESVTLVATFSSTKVLVECLKQLVVSLNWQLCHWDAKTKSFELGTIFKRTYIYMASKKYWQQFRGHINISE